MLLQWTGTVDDLLDCPPIESRELGSEMNCAEIELLLDLLKTLETEFREASRVNELRHQLIAQRSSGDGSAWRERDPLPRGIVPGAFAVWSMAFVRPLPDGTRALQSRFTLARGYPNGYQHFLGLATQVVRTLNPLVGETRSLDDQHLLAVWMLELHRSVRSGLLGLDADYQVGRGLWHSARDYLARRERLKERAGASTSPTAPAPVESGGWMAELRPECFFASAVKIQAIRHSLGRSWVNAKALVTWKGAEWIRLATKGGLNPDTLRMTHRRKGRPLVRGEGRGREYQLLSVMNQWEQHREALEQAMKKDVDRA